MSDLRKAISCRDGRGRIGGKPCPEHEAEVVAAARRFLALTETGQRVVVRQNRLGESIIHMEGNPLADAADNLKAGTYYVIPADYLTEEDT